MEFHDYPTAYELPTVKRLCTDLSRQQFYQHMKDAAIANHNPPALYTAQAESEWLDLHQPYYNVWPTILPLIQKLKLEINSELLKLPLQCLVLRFPKSNNPLKFDGGQVQTIIVSRRNVREIENTTNLDRQITQGFAMFVDVGERVHDGPIEMPWFHYRVFPSMKDTSLEDVIEALPRQPSSRDGVRVPDRIMDDCLRAVLCVSLLANNPKFVQRCFSDVVKGRGKDRRRAIEERNCPTPAWDVGRNLSRSVSPHFRSPHLAIVWTGPGRRVPKIVLRTGEGGGLISVNPKKLETVPTGYDG
jgi:hypothetical protein